MSEVSAAATPPPPPPDAAEVAWLRSEVGRLAGRESDLTLQLERQKGKLALVLRRAAALSPDPDAALADELRQALAARDRQAAAHQEHVDVLAQQLGAYREEVDVLVAQCQHSRELGEIAGAAHAAGREERLLFSVEDLTSRCAALEGELREAREARTPAPSSAAQSSQTDAPADAGTDAGADGADERDGLRVAVCDLQAALEELVLARQDDAADADRLRMAVEDLEARALEGARAREDECVAAQRRLDEAAQRRQEEQAAERAELGVLVDDLRVRLQDALGHGEVHEKAAAATAVSVADHGAQTDGADVSMASAHVQTDERPAACHAASQASPGVGPGAWGHDMQQALVTQLEERCGAAAAERDALALRVDALRAEAQAALDTVRREHKAELKGCRRRVLAQCRGLLERQQAEFAAERQQTVLLVRKECAEILQDAHELVRRSRRHKEPLQGGSGGGRGGSPAPSFFNSRHDAAAVAVVSDNSSPESQGGGDLPPATLNCMSPDVALELVKRALAAQTPSH